MEAQTDKEFERSPFTPKVPCMRTVPQFIPTTIIIHSGWRVQESQTVRYHFPSSGPLAHLKIRLELQEWLKMDIMNLMEKPTTFHHLNGTFTAQTGFCPLVWRHFYSIADSTQRDGILMGIKSEAAPVTVALSQSVCQPLCPLDRVYVRVCVHVCIFRFDANVRFCWILAVCRGSVPIWVTKRQVSWYIKLAWGSVFSDSLSDRRWERRETMCHWATKSCRYKVLKIWLQLLRGSDLTAWLERSWHKLRHIWDSPTYHQSLTCRLHGIIFSDLNFVCRIKWVAWSPF